MYRMVSVYPAGDSDIVHTDNMYKIRPVITHPNFDSTTGSSSNDLDKYLKKSETPRSKLGKVLEAKKSKQPHKLLSSESQDIPTQFKMELSPGPANVLDLDKYIINKRSPISKLGKHIQALKNKPISETKTDEEKYMNQLMELEKTLDDFLRPMGLLDPAETHVVASSVVHKDTSEAVGNKKPVKSKVLDLAIHCDPASPPFAFFHLLKVMKADGVSISVQFYRHCLLKSVPSYLDKLESHFITGPRSSSNGIIVSVVWQPCAFGCMLVENPFLSTPLYGEMAILKYMCANEGSFEFGLKNISSLEAAIEAKDSNLFVDCVKVLMACKERHTVCETIAFVYGEQTGMSRAVQQACKSWYDRQMSDPLSKATCDLIKLCH